MIRKAFDWILNTNPLVKWANGYKTQFAGALIGASVLVDTVVPFTPVEIGIQLAVISLSMKKIAGCLGVVGVAGKIAKPSEPKLIVVPRGEEVA